jgi:hypothetical protein
MAGKPTSFPGTLEHALDKIPAHAQEVIAGLFGESPTLSAAADHSGGPGDHFAPHATVDLPDGALAGLEHASLPPHVADWLL